MEQTNEFLLCTAC